MRLRRIRLAGGLGLLLIGMLAGCSSRFTPPDAASFPTRQPPRPTASPAPSPTVAPSPTPLVLPTLKVPEGFSITLYAQTRGEARMIAFDAQGVPYVTLMNRATPGGGKVLALPDRDGDGRADEVLVVRDGLERPNSLLLHQGSMYVSDPGSIMRLIDQDGDLRAEQVERVVEGLPTKADHWSRPFLFDQDGSILVAIGSSCNACQEGDKSRATVMRYAADGARTLFASGLRSVVSMAWAPGSHDLWVVNNGRDGIGPDLPPDSATIVRQGEHHGWPYCYSDRQVDPEILADPGVVTPDGTPKDEFCRTRVTTSTMVLPPHVAPLSLAFYQAEQFPERMRGGLFMSWHGAWDFANINGFRVVFVPFVDGVPGDPQDFVTGWLKPDASGWIERPVGLAVAPDGSLFVSDDVHGSIYRVTYGG